jgi:hypothetical protein
LRPNFTPLGHCPLPPGSGALADQLAPEFRDSCQHRDQEATRQLDQLGDLRNDLAYGGHGLFVHLGRAFPRWRSRQFCLTGVEAGQSSSVAGYLTKMKRPGGFAMQLLSHIL